MEDSTYQVNYQEAISIRVGNWLIQKGFIPAGSDGIVLKELIEEDSIGILLRNLAIQKRRYFFGLIKTKPRRVFIGTIWFDNPNYGANMENWVFRMCGREYKDLAMQLAAEMITFFNVNISFHLVSEQPETEMYLEDDPRYW